MTTRRINFNGAPVEAYPLHWPAGIERTSVKDRQRANFGRMVRAEGATWSSKRSMTISQAIERLMYQVRTFTRSCRPWRIDPAMVVISTNMPTRNDGLPYSNAREPDDPGVAVYFHLDRIPYCMALDSWDRVADNITAIAKHLEAIRGMERWGVKNLHRQFQGFKALPPGSGQSAPAGSQEAMTVERAAHIVLDLAGDRCDWLPSDLVRAPEFCDRAYKLAAMQCHPDRAGSEADFLRLQQAADLLKRYHAGAL